MSKKSPQLRFEGFTDDWEERKLGELGSVSMNKRIFKEQTSENGEVPFFKIGTFGSKPDAFISRELFEEYKSKYHYPEIGDVLISASGSIGRTVVYQGKDEYFQDSNIVWLKHDNRLNNKFLQQFYSIVKWQGLEGSTIKRLYNKNILDTSIIIPRPEEQYKIGLFFEQFDDTIALHQRKLDLLKEQKKGYLQKMFPKNGAKVPELRFSGFADDWEQRKLNEVSDIYDGTHQTPKYQDNGVMFLSVENIKTLTSNKFISREAFEDEFKIRPQRGDVLMTRIGDIGTANVVETDEDLAYYVSLALFKSEELNPYFLQASIYAPFVQDQIWKRTLHIAFPKKINKNEIGQVPINVPTLAEQTKIGSFFKQLDNTITLHQRKLDLLKEQKKGFLQKMFV